MKKRYGYIAIGIVLLFRLIFYLNCAEIAELAPDSYSYINYGRIGGMRTPIYPLIIRICYIVAGENFYLFVTAMIQIFFSMIAVYYLWKIFNMITDRYILNAIVVILYGCNSGICTYDVFILSESLAISLSVLFLYSIIKYVKTVSFSNGIWVVITSLVATGIKPTLAVYTGVCLVLLIMQFFLLKKERDIVFKVTAVLGGGISSFCRICLY